MSVFYPTAERAFEIAELVRVLGAQVCRALGLWDRELTEGLLPGEVCWLWFLVDQGSRSLALDLFQLPALSGLVQFRFGVSLGCFFRLQAAISFTLVNRLLQQEASDRVVQPKHGVVAFLPLNGHFAFELFQLSCELWSIALLFCVQDCFADALV